MPTCQLRGRLSVLWIVSVLLFYGCNNSIDPAEIEETTDDAATPEYTTETGKGIAQGFKPNKNWVMSVEAGADFEKLYTDSSGKTYAISNHGLIYSCTGNLNWQREYIESSYTSFFAIGGSGNDIYAAGSPSALFHKKGDGDWEREKFPHDSLYFTAVYSCNNELWLSTWPKGPIWHRNKAGTWQQELKSNDLITKLYGNGMELWALGARAVYHKKPGSDWDSINVTNEKVSFHTLYQYGKQIWIMGSAGNIFYNNGGKQWIKETVIDAKHDILCSYGYQNDVYAAGSNGLVLHRLPNGKWGTEETGYQDFSAKCIYGQRNNLWLGGSNGFIFHKNGNGVWTKEAGPVRGSEINAISSRGDTLIAAAKNATLLTNIHNAGWEKAASIMPDTPFSSIFSFSKGILVGAKNGMLYHLKEDGKWQLENGHAGDVMYADLYENEQSIYLVGSKGVVTWRHKTDTTWTSTITGTSNLIRIYGYGDNIYILGHGSTLLHKKENETNWKPVNIGLISVDFMDAYGYKDQLWALGVKDNRGIIFYKDSNDKWTTDDVHKGLDHFHALYGHGDTVYAAGAYGDWASKDKTEVPYEGTIICKAGNKPWEVQINRFSGVHFNAINGTGDKIYALGSGGTVFYKEGNADWVQEETYLDNENLSKLLFHKGLLMLSDEGFVYRENEEKNFIRINRTDKLINIVELNGELYCAGRNAIFKIKPTVDKYPVVDKVNYTLSPAINPTSVNLNFVLQYPRAPTTNENYGVEFYAKAYTDGYVENKWIQVDASKTKVKINPETYTIFVSTNIEVVKSFRVIPGMESANKICLRVDVKTRDGLSRECFVIKDAKGNPYITLHNNIWLKYKWYILGIGLVLLYYLSLLFWAIFFPRRFVRLYHSGKLQALMSLKQPLLMGVINVFVPLKKLVAMPRVLNAWTRDFAQISDAKFNLSEIAMQRKCYVQLPVRKDNPATGDLIEKPDETLMNELFNKNRSIIQIIGPGGSGKTSLAVEMGRWMIQSAKMRKTGHTPRVPILLESDSQDMLNEITGTLRSWQNDYTIQEDFVKMLLKSQRLVVIVDSLSERPDEKQEYFKQLHGHLPVNALIITARQPIDLQVREGTYLYPLPLNSNNLLHFITTYLSSYPNHPVQESREQLAFAEKIVSIIEGNNKALITPILVRLIIEMAISTKDNGNKDFQTVMQGMPNSIPEVYYQYLAHINPANPAAANYLPKLEMLKIAELLGRLSLGDNFLPKDFTEEEARKAISQMHPNITADPIQRFIDNGILIRKTYLANEYFRFNLDPLAEYLAASKLYTEHNTNREELQAFIEEVNNLHEEAQEFKMAFSQIFAYKMKHG
jgi:photosystem II stability/assembly factor-like uncharacterized protein